MKNTLYISKLDCPYQNLALEYSLFEGLSENENKAMVYINKPCVVFGRFQNPFIETNIAHILERKIPLVRRFSGGGCVYHDHGNINFSWMSQDKEKIFLIDLIKKTLKTGGFLRPLESTSFYDLLALDENNEWKKILGSAFKVSRQKTLHHVCLLNQTDLTELRFSLKSKLKDYITETRSLPSRPKSVMNVSCENLTIQFQKVFSFDEVCIIDESNLDQFKGENYLFNYKKLTSQDWIIYQTPAFSFEVKQQHKQLRMSFKKGLEISEVEYNDEDLSKILCHDIENRLQGLKLSDQLLRDFKLWLSEFSTQDQALFLTHYLSFFFK